MAAEYMHVGIPVLNKKPNMVYNEWGKFWVNESVDAYDFKIEYLKFDEGTIFPEILSKQPQIGACFVSVGILSSECKNGRSEPFCGLVERLVMVRASRGTIFTVFLCRFTRFPFPISPLLSFAIFV